MSQTYPCYDHGCPVHTGHYCHATATTTLRRIDMDDGRLYFCDACADDALESGVFAVGR